MILKSDNTHGMNCWMCRFDTQVNVVRTILPAKGGMLSPPFVLLDKKLLLKLIDTYLYE